MVSLSDTQLKLVMAAASHVPHEKRSQFLARIAWRRGWDSNPRTPCDVASFQDWCLQPLGHLSVAIPVFVFARVAPLWPRGRFDEVKSVVSQGDTLLRLPVFKTGALNHSATLPAFGINYLRTSKKNK